jgi:hypothetical protein
MDAMFGLAVSTSMATKSTAWSRLPNVRDQRRRAVGAPLADRNLSTPVPFLASGVTTRDDRCIA